MPVLTPQRKRRLKRATLATALLLSAAFCTALVVARFTPLPERLAQPGSAVVTYRGGQVAHVFLSPDDKWRIDADFDAIDPAFITALIAREDKRFYWHLGTDPLAILRAAVLNLSSGRVVSGGSTLTSQLVRVLEPRPRTLTSKVIEMFVALQLEMQMSKEEILRAYLTFTPFGRNLEGIQAASLSYFGHRANALSLAEIATLLAVPQRPSARFPSPRNQKRLKTARDYIAADLLEKQVLPSQITNKLRLAEVTKQPVPSRLLHFPRELPHAAPWLRRQARGARFVRSTLDADVQALAVKTLQSTQENFANQGIHNGAVVVVDHRTSEVLALVGNFDFWDAKHGGQIVGFDVPRSPGSTLKPLIYAMAIDAGIALPEYLVPDIPVNHAGYAPKNYDGGFSGLVRLQNALSQSLNIPFVELLSQIGTERFVATLRQLGAHHLSNEPGHYGLSAAIGGIELTPLELASVYTVFAKGGLFTKVRALQTNVPPGVAPGAAPSPAATRVLTPGSTWLTRRALSLKDRPDFPSRRRFAGKPGNIHWKTGTSFGHRDAWSVGSNAKFTAVIWLGNFDNSPSRELVGAKAAGPLLFDVLEALSDGRRDVDDPMPSDLTAVEVCRLSGRLPAPGCGDTEVVFALAQNVPTQTCPYHVQIDIDDATGLALTKSCRAEHEYTTKSFLDWPVEVRRYLASAQLRIPAIPSLMPGCDGDQGHAPVILSPKAREVSLLVPGLEASAQEIPLLAAHTAPGAALSWFVDGDFLGTTPADKRMWWTPKVGTHEVVVTDDRGRSDATTFEVRRLRPMMSSVPRRAQ